MDFKRHFTRHLWITKAFFSFAFEDQWIKKNYIESMSVWMYAELVKNPQYLARTTFSVQRIFHRPDSREQTIWGTLHFVRWQLFLNMVWISLSLQRKHLTHRVCSHTSFDFFKFWWFSMGSIFGGIQCHLTAFISNTISPV